MSSRCPSVLPSSLALSVMWCLSDLIVILLRHLQRSYICNDMRYNRVINRFRGERTYALFLIIICLKMGCLWLGLLWKRVHVARKGMGGEGRDALAGYLRQPRRRRYLLQHLHTTSRLGGMPSRNVPCSADARTRPPPPACFLLPLLAHSLAADARPSARFAVRPYCPQPVPALPWQV